MPPQLTGRVPFNPLTLLLSLFFGLVMFVVMLGLALVGLVMLGVTRLLGLFGIKIGPAILRGPLGGATVFGPGGPFAGRQRATPSATTVRPAPGEPEGPTSDAEPAGPATPPFVEIPRESAPATPAAGDAGRVIGMERAPDGSWRTTR